MVIYKKNRIYDLSELFFAPQVRYTFKYLSALDFQYICTLFRDFQPVKLSVLETPLASSGTFAGSLLGWWLF